MNSNKRGFLEKNAPARPGNECKTWLTNRLFETIDGQQLRGAEAPVWTGDWRLAIAEERLALAEEKLARAEAKLAATSGHRED